MGRHGLASSFFGEGLISAAAAGTKGPLPPFLRQRKSLEDEEVILLHEKTLLRVEFLTLERSGTLAGVHVLFLTEDITISGSK